MRKLIDHLLCFIGFHDWEIIDSMAATITLGSLLRGSYDSDGEVRIEKCKRCSTERGVVDTGLHQQVVDAGYLKRMIVRERLISKQEKANLAAF